MINYFATYEIILKLKENESLALATYDHAKEVMLSQLQRIKDDLGWRGLTRIVSYFKKMQKP